MLVKDLIARLQACSPDAEVVLAWDRSEVEALGRVEAGVALLEVPMWVTPEEAQDLALPIIPQQAKCDADWPSVALWPAE